MNTNLKQHTKGNYFFEMKSYLPPKNLPIVSPKLWKVIIEIENHAKLVKNESSFDKSTPGKHVY
jgi:hypothetical protein